MPSDPLATAIGCTYMKSALAPDPTSPPDTPMAPLNPQRERRILGLNTAVVLGSLLFFSLVLELSARIFIHFYPAWGHWQVSWPRLADPDNIWWDPDAELFWRLKPNMERLGTNRYGLRGADFPVEKPPGVLRVVSIGDSSAFGCASPNLRPEETYAARLESLLNEHDSTHRWHVINAGVPGYTSLQGLRYLPRLERFAPDAIVVYFGRNDRLLEPYSDADRSIENAALGNFVLSALGRSKFCMCVGNALIRAETVLLGKAELPNRSDYVPRVSPTKFRQNLSQIVQMGNKWGAPVFVMPYVLKGRRKNLYSLEGPLKYDVGGACVVDFLGPWRTYLEQNGEPPEAIMADTFHPNAIGHRLIAQTLFEAFVEHGLVAADQAPTSTTIRSPESALERPLPIPHG